MKFVTCAALLCLSLAAPSLAEPNESAAAFERLKKLSGTWDSIESVAGRASTVTYTLTGRGSVLLERAGGMLTAYHLDKGTLVMTHYCGAGNQPRMRIKNVANDGRRIRFEMYDITNLVDPNGPRSTALDVVFLSEDRVDLAFQGVYDDNKTAQTFHLTRKSATALPSAALVPRSPKTNDTMDAFTRLKTLVGTWEVTERDNPNTRELATYEITGRNVLTEDLRAAAGSANHTMGHMFTTYHMDKDRLVLTHYCGAGNQPRMRLRSVEEGGNRLSFEMYDITNLLDPKAYHSTAVDVVFLADDRVDLVYTGRAGDKTVTQVFQLQRQRRNGVL